MSTRDKTLSTRERQEDERIRKRERQEEREGQRENKGQQSAGDVIAQLGTSTEDALVLFWF
jgi:hypothetical protein